MTPVVSMIKRSRNNLAAIFYFAVVNILITLSILVISGCTDASDGSRTQRLSQADVLKIAAEKATAIGYDVTKAKALIDEDNSIWKDQLKRIPPEYTKIVAHLKHRDYYAVYC